MKNALLFLQAETRLHAGTGGDLGAVDLPIQREKTTKHPFIRGESLKGALRDVFGKSNENLFDEGALGVAMDAQLVAFPAATLVDTFAYVSCPYLINRLRRKFALIGEAPPAFKCEEGTTSNLAWADGEFVINDYMTDVRYNDGTAKTSARLQSMALRSDSIFGGDFFQSHFIVIKDFDFKQLVESGTDIGARNKIGTDGTTDTESGGNLFYEENLPEETILCAMLRYDEGNDEAKNMIRKLNDADFILSIGGAKNAAHGFCWTKTYPEEDGNG